MSNPDFYINKRVFYFLIAIPLFVFFIPSIITEGMFFDGLTYSSISRNLANGEGSMFSLKYTETLGNPFYDHPPVFFIIQSVFFQVLGDSVWVEKFFCAVFLLINIVLFYYLIKNTVFDLFGFESQKIHVPAILFLAFCTPVLIWTYRNNLLEIVLTTFSTAAIFFYVKSLISGKNWKIFLCIFLSVVCVFLSIGVKGLVGSFPLVVPVFLFFFLKKIGKSVLRLPFLSFYLIFILILLLVLQAINSDPELKNYFEAYINNQLIKSITGQREITGSRFQIIFSLIENLTIPVLIIVIGHFLAKGRKMNMNQVRNIGFFFLFIALCSSLPIMLSPKQRDFYIMPSLPFFAAGFYFIFIEKYTIFFTKLSEKGPYLIIKCLTVVSFLIPIIFPFVNKSPDMGMIEEIRGINSNYHNSVMCVSKENYFDWKLQAYLQRYCSISITDVCEYENSIKHSLLIDKKPNNFKITIESYER